MEYILRYARVVDLSRRIEANSHKEAEEIASELEANGELGIEMVVPKTDSDLEDITDDPSQWEVEAV